VTSHGDVHAILTLSRVTDITFQFTNVIYDTEFCLVLVLSSGESAAAKRFNLSIHISHVSVSVFQVGVSFRYFLSLFGIRLSDCKYRDSGIGFRLFAALATIHSLLVQFCSSALVL